MITGHVSWRFQNIIIINIANTIRDTIIDQIVLKIFSSSYRSIRCNMIMIMMMMIVVAIANTIGLSGMLFSFTIDKFIHTDCLFITLIGEQHRNLNGTDHYGVIWLILIQP